MTHNYYSGQAHVDVMMFTDYKTGGMVIPASESRPCKLSLPVEIAERFVNNGLAEFCDVTDDIGPKGEPGIHGCDGTDGTDGTPGQKGTDGSDGLDGSPGLPGEMGRRGREGIHSNVKGPTGNKGCDGVQGECGPPGIDGTPGADGTDGAAGPPGPKGVKGEQGPPGMVGDVGPAGGQGMPGDVGMAGPNGVDGYVCPTAPMFEKIEVSDGLFRIITRDADCNVLDDFMWDTSPVVVSGDWCRESQVTVDFDADDLKVRDDPNGFSYELPDGRGGTCRVDLNFGVPSAQPCRSTSCGYVPGNAYEDTYPNVNAYGTDPSRPCEDIDIEVCFDCPICGDIAIRFIDVDETSGGDGGENCNEQIKSVNPAPSGVNGQLVEISPGLYTGQGSGNTDSEGELLFTNLDGVEKITFQVRLIGGRSMGFGFTGTQTFKFVETGTYVGDEFFDDAGNPIPEPTGWTDC